MTRTTCRSELADSLKEKGVKLGKGAGAMIAELGHFALILAIGVALFQLLVPLYGAQRGDRGADAQRSAARRCCRSC